ncbi:hypothetical protein SH528x_004176 [Novipirellula sp. SH528]|uniref:hypothetical protein n=1 Tax=Novipirellula sp. SH528 TaxID=3454466 RepID=UPI003FA046A9
MFHDHTLWTLSAISFSAALSAPVYALTPLHQPIDTLVVAQPHAASGWDLIGDDRLSVTHSNGNVGMYQLSKVDQRGG